MVTIAEQIKSVKRETDYLKRVCPRWVQEGKISRQEADYQIEALEYAVNTLQAVLDFQRGFIAKNHKLF